MFVKSNIKLKNCLSVCLFKNSWRPTIFSKPDACVEAVLHQTKHSSLKNKLSLFYLKFPTAVISSLQHAECKAVEQNLAQIPPVNYKQTASKHLSIQSMHSV